MAENMIGKPEMDDIRDAVSGNENAARIAENEQIQELLALLKEHNISGREQFTNLIDHVSEIELRLAEVVEELKAIRQEMQWAKNHPLQASVQEGCGALEVNHAAANQQLSALKKQIIDGCGKILTEFKERGAVALNGITQFLHIRPALQIIQNSAKKGMEACDSAVSRIDAYSREYHETGRHLKNMWQALRGKPMETDAKANGKIAAAFRSAFNTERALIASVSRSAEQSLNNLTRLEQIAERRHPSVEKGAQKQSMQDEPSKGNPEIAAEDTKDQPAGQSDKHIADGVSSPGMDADALMKQIDTGTKEIFTDERYGNFLRTVSKFPQYSARNCMLISMQKPDATYVAGAHTWQKDFGRHVKKGKAGIRILAPCTEKVTTELKDAAGHIRYGADGKPLTMTKERIIPHSYRPVYVYDVSQTDGKELPQMTAEHRRAAQDGASLMNVLCRISSVPIVIDEMQGHPVSSRGYFDPESREIHIRQGMSEAQTVKTAVHEVAHAMLHAPERNLPPEEQTDRVTREVQADSVAFILCDHLGVDTSEYTFDNLAQWRGDRDLNELQSNLFVIQKTASQLIRKTDKELENLKQPEIKAEQTVKKPISRLADRISAAKEKAATYNDSHTAQKQQERNRNSGIER